MEAKMEDKEVRQIVAAILATGGDDPREMVGRYSDILQMLLVNVVTVKAGSEEEELAGAGRKLAAAGGPVTVILREFDD
jgi:hypothetical protein